jgi:hypothetical protein
LYPPFFLLSLSSVLFSTREHIYFLVITTPFTNFLILDASPSPRLNLYPRSFPDVDVKPSNPNGLGLTREQREFEQDLRLERQTLAQAHTRDSRVLRKAWW